MSAIQEIKTLGIVAGGGDLPRQLIDACAARGISVFVAALDGHCASLGADVDHTRFRIGQAGSVIKAFQQRDIKHLVLIGSLTRPNWRQLVPDLKTMEFIVKFGLSAGGDDDLLKKLRRFLEAEGFTIHGVQAFMPDLLAGDGVLGAVQPTAEQMDDIKVGFKASQALGAEDLGQAVIVRGGVVCAREDAGGTNAMIARCGDSTGGILVKSCKPQQDMDLDLPTIGLNTLERAKDAGLSGVAVHAGRSLLLDRADVITFADVHNMFIVGYDGG